MHTPDRIESRKVSDLRPSPNNARTHSAEQVQQIGASIQRFGFTAPVLIDGSGTIIAGHGRVLAAQAIGMTEVPCIELTHLTPDEQRAYMLADNQLALNAGWDPDILAAEIAAIDLSSVDVELTGFGEAEIAELLGRDQDGLTDPDDAPEAQANAVSKTGDVWICGAHRVMCGDSTSAKDVARLMDGQMADIIVTDPPYGVSYADKNRSLNAADEGNRVEAEIKNDHLKGDALGDFFLAAFSSMFTAMKPGAPFYVCAPQGGEQMMMMMMMAKAGMPMRHELIWAKNILVLGRADYHYKHEPILYGWKEGGAHPWYGGRDKTSVWEVNKPHKSDMHPTMKPVELIEIPLNNSSKAGDIVLDMFGGSGTTMIAAEKTGRQARLMEIAPEYVDVAVKRWQQYTGKRATNAATGEPFPE